MKKKKLKEELEQINAELKFSEQLFDLPVFQTSDVHLSNALSNLRMHVFAAQDDLNQIVYREI